ncbi:MAG: hypothetical protein AAFP20_21150, partial [Cyanobacteria bacterium J06614_10]
MSERLDRIEAILERTAQRQEKQAEDIDTLLGVVATNERKVRDLTDKSKYNEQLFEVLRAEAQADRDETRRLFNDAVSQMETDREALRAEAQADRDETRRLFDDAVKQMEAAREALQAEAQADRDETRRLFNDAVSQMETDREALRA